MVGLYKEQFGRGPTRVRTHWCGGDVLTVIREDTLTPAERNVVKMCAHQRLRDLRLFFQYATVREFCEPVEQITGRRVRSFISGIDTEADGLATELFVLHPRATTARHASSTPEPSPFLLRASACPSKRAHVGVPEGSLTTGANRGSRDVRNRSSAGRCRAGG